MIPLVLMLEECHITRELMVIAAEVEEKYFNRVIEAIQVSIMRALGLPP